MNDQDRISLESVVGEVMLERHRQDRKWGGAQHDDRHSVADFVRYIRNYSGWADQMADAMSLDKARRRLIQVAALAVAAVQAIDRRWDREGKSIERRQVTEYIDGEGVLIERLRQLTGFEGEASIPKVLEELEKLSVARVSLPEEAAAYMFPDDLANFSEKEAIAHAYSMPMISACGDTIPLYTKKQIDEALIEAARNGE